MLKAISFLENDFFELDKRLEQYRDHNHDFIKEIFTLEHVYTYFISRDLNRILEDPKAYLDKSFNVFLPCFVSSFFSDKCFFESSKKVNILLSKKLSYRNLLKIKENELKNREEEVYSNNMSLDKKSKRDIEISPELAIVLILMSLLAMLPMPDMYYRVLRVCIFIFTFFVFFKTSYNSKISVLKIKMLKILFVVFGILFNPVLPFHFARTDWIIFNLFFSILCLFLILALPRKHSEK